MFSQKQGEKFQSMAFPITTIKTVYNQDVRRFSAWCNSKGKPEYAKTMDAIASAYKLKKTEFEIQYKDVDGDIVQIKTTKELRHAFKEIVENTALRLIVKPIEDEFADLPDLESSDEENIEQEKKVKEDDSSKWSIMDKKFITAFVENTKDRPGFCHPFCNQMHISPSSGKPIKKKKPVCFFVLYHMCLNQEIIPYDQRSIDYMTIKDKWNKNDRIHFYFSALSESDIGKYKAGNVLECILELACRLCHMKTVKRVTKSQHYRWTDEGFAYIQTLV